VPFAVYVPFIAALTDTKPRPPVCCTVAVQLQPPPVASVQVPELNPRLGRTAPRLSQVVVVPDSVKQPWGRVKDSLPVVVVLSTYDPSDFAVQVPVTWREPPVNEPVLHGALAVPAPSDERSSEPLGSRQDDETDHIPTTLPPQPVTLEKLMQAGVLPLLELDDDPEPELPVVPDDAPALVPEDVEDEVFEPPLEDDPLPALKELSPGLDDPQATATTTMAPSAVQLRAEYDLFIENSFGIRLFSQWRAGR
jgi:hypothetical protein